MSLLRWGPFFETGIAEIDRQHRGLLDLLNSLANLLTRDDAQLSAELDQLFAELVRYAAEHFSCEERMMKEWGLDSRYQLRHRDFHLDFTRQVQEMRDRLHDSSQVHAEDILGFLTNWLIYHILGEDQSLVRQVRFMEGGDSAEQAYQREVDGGQGADQNLLIHSIVELYSQLSRQNRDLQEVNREMAAAHEALRSSERYHQQLLDSLSEGVMVHDAEGRIQFANPAAQRILGLTEENLFGPLPVSCYRDIVREDGSACPFDDHPVARTLKRGEDQDAVIMGLPATGGVIRWVSMNTRALYAHDDPAELVSVLVSFRDISRYRATEQSLRRREEIYRAIVSQALDAIVLIDLESQRFVEFNDAAYLGLGYSREEFARLHVNDIHERHADETFEQELAERYMSRLRAGEGVVMEHPHIARDGSRRNVRVSMRYLKIADKEYLAGIWSDITERTQIDAELARYRAELEDQVELRTAELEQTNRELRAARDAAEEASRAKNEFVQQISEQLRGPVQEITERLRDSQPAVIDEELRRQLAAMANAGDRLRGIIERMAGFSWMEGDELLLTPVAFALSTLLARTLDEQRVLAEEKGLQLQWRRDSGLPDQVVGDPVWLGQVLAGLLRNAVQYSERGQVALRCLRLYRGGSQLWLRFEVEDQGRGMTAEQQERLSDYLQMTDMAVGAGSSGIGSGLALARRVTALMGGQMGLVSTLGRGSLFWLELNLPETGSDASAGGDAFGSGQA